VTGTDASSPDPRSPPLTEQNPDLPPGHRVRKPAKTPRKPRGVPDKPRRAKTLTNRSIFTPEQLESFYAEIEDWMFCEGLHQEEAVGRLVRRYKIKYHLALSWIHRVRRRWREAQSHEDLTDRQYQLERLAHTLYQTALDGIPPELRRQLRTIEQMLKDGEVDTAREKIHALAKGKLRNLSVAQRVLWNLSTMAGIGHKVTLDLSGAGVTLPEIVKALPGKTEEPR
jgi:hypothetical protein